ncbi:MAG: ATPase, T2SS/T4P/T4SS family [bacterium]|nr:ATPase, T2SS/T4P/T4SS family [bacterium]
MTPAKNKKSKDDLISMEEAILLLKTTRPTFYRWLRCGKVKGMKVGRQWRFYRNDIERFLKGEEPRISLTADINPLLTDLLAYAKKINPKLKFDTVSNDVRSAVSLMISIGTMSRSSDIHLCPNLSKDQKDVVVSLRYRIDGVLHEAATFDVRLLPAIIEQWKRLAALDVNEKLKPQDGRILTEVIDPKNENGVKMVDVRICTIPSGLGESLTARILDSSGLVMNLDKINFTPEARAILDKHIKAPWGLILFTGPTGSGKTTALYCCLNQLTGPKLKAISIEDPIEYYLPWITQVMVNPSHGVTFSSAMKAIMRSDPDVIMIGDIRDSETLSVGLEAALTGHLVMSQMHVDEAARALKRMVDLGSDPFVISDATKLVMSQRLVRKLCPDCSAKDKLSKTNLEWAKTVAESGGLKWSSIEKNFRKAVGCEKCGGIGYKGREIVSEMLEVTPEIGKALRENASVEELREIAVGQGMITIVADTVRRAANGETTLEEAMRVGGSS